MQRSILLKKIKTIELQIRGRTETIFSGQYKSAFKGRGMSFSEVRSYQIGDEVRRIDWNVTARFQSPFVKVFEEERELILILVIDVSGSMFFGAQEESKWSKAVEIAATLAFSAGKNNDKVGAIFVSDKVELYIPPKKGNDHINRMLHQYISLSPTSRKTDFTQGLNYLLKLHRQRCTCVLISDFTSVESCFDTLPAVVKKHEVIAIKTSDSAEKKLPNLGFIRLINSETGKISWIDSASEQVRQQFASDFDKNHQLVLQKLAGLKIKFSTISTNDDVFKSLRKLFDLRQ